MKIEATSTGSGKNRDSFDLGEEQNLPFCHLFPEPGKQLPSKFSDAVRLLTRPYYPITDVLYEEIMAVIKRLDSDIVVDEQGRQMSFGNADNMYQLMPLMKNS